MRNCGRRSITVWTGFGRVPVERTRYRCRECGHEVMAGDAELCCGRHRITRRLAEKVCQLATVEHFSRLERLMFDQHGVTIGHEELCELVHDVGGQAERTRQVEAESWIATPHSRRVWPEPEVRPERIHVSCDGIMYCTNQTEPHPADPTRRRLIWQQMRVGCVYWQTSDERWHKRVTWGRGSPEEFGAALYRLACRCGYREAGEKIFAADGGEWCWTIQTRYFADAEGILDWFHASEHVWEAARQLRSDDSAVKSWADEALGHLRHSGGKGTVAWLAEQLVGLRGKKRDAVESLRKYLLGHLDRTDYPAYRSREWQIGTGMIESTARQLVGLRLKGPGMHWTEAGALAVTALRAIDLNDQWHTFWKSLALSS
jgi:hypothetical protein